MPETSQLRQEEDSSNSEEGVTGKATAETPEKKLTKNQRHRINKVNKKSGVLK